MKELSVDNLTQTCKIIFLNSGLPSKIVSDADTDFVSKLFENFCKSLNMHHAVYHLTTFKAMKMQKHELIC